MLILLGAAVGTALLAFVPSAAWLDLPVDGDPYALFSAYLLKESLTVILLLIVPALWAHSGHRFGAWAILALSALAFGAGYLFTRDVKAGLYTLLLIALPGAGLWALEKLHLNNFRTVLYTSVLNLFALFIYVCLPDLLLNGNAYLPFRTVIEVYTRIVRDAEPALALLNDGSFENLMELLTEIKLESEQLGIPALVIVSMTAGLSNVLFSHLFNTRKEVLLPALPPFSEWRCERMYVYIATGFALVTYGLAMFSVNGMETLSSVAMLLWNMPCALAGLAGVRRLALRAKKGWIFFIVCAGLAMVPSFGLTLLAMLGMISSLRKPIDRKDGQTL